MKKLFFIFIFFVLQQNLRAQVWSQAVDQNQAPVDFQARAFSETDFKTYPWMREFSLVIVINKANEGREKQSLRIYQNQKIIFLTKVSTGRERFEEGCKPGQDPKADHCSQRPYWSTTPTGYFDVDTLDPNYFSNLWQTWMPYAVFFESGIATHQAPAGTEGRLGQRASGGCVRTHPTAAPAIFKLVSEAGQGLVPKVNRDGSLAVTKQGDTIRQQGYRTLVIVENRIKP